MSDIDILGSLDQYAGYTIMKHTTEPELKYRLQVWYLRPGWNVPKSIIAWGVTPENAYDRFLSLYIKALEVLND